MLCFSLGQNAQAEAYLLSASALYNDYKIGICEDYIAHEINYCTYLAGSNRTVESLSKLRGLHNDVLSYDAACPLLWHIEAAIGSVLQAMGRLIDGRKWLANAYNRYRTLYGDHTADAAQLRALMDSCQ